MRSAPLVIQDVTVKNRALEKNCAHVSILFDVSYETISDPKLASDPKLFLSDVWVGQWRGRGMGPLTSNTYHRGIRVLGLGLI